MSPQSAVADLAQAALLFDDLNRVFALAMDLLCDVLGTEYAAVLHQPGGDQPLVLMAGTGWQSHVRVGETTVECDARSQIGYTMMAAEPVLVEDLSCDSRFTGPQLLIEHGVVSGMSQVIRGPEGLYGVVGSHSVHQRRFTTDDGDFLRSVANILGMAIANGRFAEKVGRQSRYDVAIAECAQALLASSGEDRIEHALQALLTATEANCVFVERNIHDPELGFASRTVAVAEQPGSPAHEVDDAYWDLVPWESMPYTRRFLEIGLPAIVIPEELEGAEYDLYAVGPFPVKAELDLPIFVDGNWEGLIGLSDQTEVRPWTETDLSLLTTAAKMMGVFWERERARDQLEEMNRAKDAFLASVSHELRTPLTAVVGFGELLTDVHHTLSARERAELLEAIVTEGTDLTNIVNDLLVAAKSGIDRLEVSSVRVDLRAQAAQVLESFESTGVGNIDLVGDSMGAVGDPDRVRQIVRNLISNALRYGGNTIRVTVSDSGTVGTVAVHDDGAAIPEFDRDRIFEPYQRAHNAPGLADSLGLGLAISRQLARLMDGDLTYRHEGGESIFELSLPQFG